MTDLHKLAQAILDDDHGVNIKGYWMLLKLASNSKDQALKDMLKKVEANNDRFYLPENV